MPARHAAAGKYTGLFDDKADAYLAGTARRGRMQRLIDDLLRTRGSAARRGVQARRREAGSRPPSPNLRVGLDEAGAVLTHDPLPTVRSDPSQLVQLFQNLTRERGQVPRGADARIHVGAAREPGQWRFSVRDQRHRIEPQFRSASSRSSSGCTAQRPTPDPGSGWRSAADRGAARRPHLGRVGAGPGRDLLLHHPGRRRGAAVTPGRDRPLRSSGRGQPVRRRAARGHAGGGPETVALVNAETCSGPWR